MLLTRIAYLCNEKKAMDNTTEKLASYAVSCAYSLRHEKDEVVNGRSGMSWLGYADYAAPGS